jgi:hypothetical protein
VVTDVEEEHTTSIFRVEEGYPEDGGYRFLGW